MSLHRTQLLLEPWQHARLKALAAEQGLSLSELVRAMVSEGLERRPAKRNPIMGIIGLVTDGGEPLTNEQIDNTVYGKDWE